MLRSVLSAIVLTLTAACAASLPPATVFGAPLAGTSWRQIDPAPPAGVQAPTITFGEDGRASGFTGCNQWFASVSSTAGGGLHFGQAGSTRRMCQPEAMEVEQAFLAGIGRTMAAERDGDTLRLIGNEADQIAVFTPSTPER